MFGLRLGGSERRFTDTGYPATPAEIARAHHLTLLLIHPFALFIRNFSQLATK